MFVRTPLVKLLAVAAIGVAACAGAAEAQTESPVVVMLDGSAIDQGAPPHAVPAEAVNNLIGNVGLRDPLPYFAARVGDTIALQGGADGSDGWFALRSVPPSWSSEPGVDDGLQNFLLAGPGL